MNCTIHTDAELLSVRKSVLFLLQTQCSFTCSDCTNRLANQQGKSKYQFIWTYTGMFELCGGCLLSLNIKILYTDINKGESNTKFDILSFWYTSVIIDNNTYRKCWKDESCLKNSVKMEGRKCNLISKYHNCRHCAEVFKARRTATWTAVTFPLCKEKKCKVVETIQIYVGTLTRVQ